MAMAERLRPVQLKLHLARGERLDASADFEQFYSDCEKWADAIQHVRDPFLGAESLWATVTMKRIVCAWSILLVMQLQQLEFTGHCSEHLQFIGNRARYSRSEQLGPNEYLNMESSQQPSFTYSQSSINSSPYKINNRKSFNKYKGDVTDGLITHGQLDSEDRDLLHKFYQETREQDPFQSDALSSQSLWDEMRDKELANLMSALRDTEQQQLPNQFQQNPLEQTRTLVVVSPTMKNWTRANQTTDWTFDDELVRQSEQLASSKQVIIDQSAKYSPTMRLLTSYNPVRDPAILLSEESQQEETRDAGRIVGATLRSEGRDSPPKVSSKSPLEAIRMHNELFEQPPRDGKVRVRMYFHRAIHDDVKMYGTGPWKYWGHGWGVEYGYDPLKSGKNDFYQKGYTIERAYGRDFCKDNKNCRPTDPQFFKDVNRMIGRKFAGSMLVPQAT